MSKTSFKTTAEWRLISWHKLSSRVYKLQKRIYRASQRGDIKAVRRLLSYVDEVLVSKSIIGS